jgi:hypothetical protein
VLFKRKECWAPTAPGWAVGCALIIIFCILGLRFVYDFLAPVHPVQAEILVAEGWQPDYALRQAVEEFKSHPYRFLVCTGIPVDYGHYLSAYKTYAAIGAAIIRNMGLDSSQVIAVSSSQVKKDRTFASAVAFRDWLVISGLPVKAINVYTLGVHAKRTQLLFAGALGEDITVGIIAGEDYSYNSRTWWRTSSGVRAIIDESIAYLYARLFLLFNKFNEASGL